MGSFEAPNVHALRQENVWTDRFGSLSDPGSPWEYCELDGCMCGAVCPQGYGLAYTVGDDDIVVQISNFVSDPSTGGSGFGGVTLSANGSDVLTDGGRFRGEIERALLDMQALFK